MKQYKKRILDEILRKRLSIFDACLIVGPKGSGKTRTAKEIAKSFIEFQDEQNRDYYLTLANSNPNKLLEGEKPRLFDEWQDAPKIWGAIRKYCDDNPDRTGDFILTGSSSNNGSTSHTGTLRISEVEMLPMSLYESLDSSGEISLGELFDNKEIFVPCLSKLDLDDYLFLICRGGWPRAVNIENKNDQLEIAKDLYRQLIKKDVSALDKKRRNSSWIKAIMTSYSRNMCTTASSKVIFNDANANAGLSMNSYIDYVDALERLYIIKDIDAWCPSLRSRTAVRAGKKRNLVDPSLAASALSVNPTSLKSDLKTAGFLFESLCIRDLTAYSSSLGGNISFYRDRYGLEADAVLHLEDGRYALIEFKLGDKEIDNAIKHLNKIEKLIVEFNKKEVECPLRLPTLKLVVTGTNYAYKKDDVFIIPLGCLKD